MKQKALRQGRIHRPQRPSKLRKHAQRVAGLSVQAKRRNPVLFQDVTQFPRPIQTDDRRHPSAAIETDGQGRQRTLRAADVEVGDDQSDRNRPIGSNHETGLSESPGEGLHE
jgi:hypothetical protein